MVKFLFLHDKRAVYILKYFQCQRIGNGDLFSNLPVNADLKSQAILGA